jgi:tetratricopeptide (TPR) repeat protein
MRARHNLAAFCFDQHQYEQARAQWDEGLRIARELGARAHETVQFLTQTGVYEACGQYETARQRYGEAQLMARDIGSRGFEAGALIGLGYVTAALGDTDTGVESLRAAVRLAREIGEASVVAQGLVTLGHVLSMAGDLDAALSAYEDALAARAHSELGRRAVEAQAGIAWIWLERGDVARALAAVECVLDCLSGRGLEGTEQPGMIMLSAYRVLEAADDPRALPTLERAYCLVQDIAAGLEDEDLRRGFLEDVTANRELVEAYDRSREP